MLQKVLAYIRSKDGIMKPSHTRLNFMGDVKQKTFIGGIFSMFISLYVLYIAVDKAHYMIMRVNPTIRSIVKGYHQDDKVRLEDLPVVLLEIWGQDTSRDEHHKLGEGDSARSMFKPIELDESTKRYMDIKLKQVTVHFNDQGHEWTESKYFGVEKCKEDFFVKTDLEKEFWDKHKDSSQMYCL